MTENGGGYREKDKRRIGYGESGERWMKRPEAKVFANREHYKKAFHHASSPESVAPDINAFRKSCIHTPYFLSTIFFLIPESTNSWELLDL
jgi:hypothetical protein